MAGVRRFRLVIPLAFDPAAPLALARLHRDLAVGEVATVRYTGPPHVLGGGGFEVDEVAGERVVIRRARTLPDFVGPDMRVLVCGLNPSLVAADAGYGYAGPTNRFWPSALDAALVTKARDPWHALEHDGVGMTDLVKRATASAAGLSADEYAEGAARVELLVGWLRPAAVLFVGLSGWRAAVNRRAGAGWQPGGFGGAAAYVMPSTSGLNAHATRSSLVAHIHAAVGVA